MLAQAYRNPTLVASVIKAVAWFIASDSQIEAEREAQAARQLANGELSFDEIACCFFNIQVREGGGDSYPTLTMREIRACEDFRLDPPVRRGAPMRSLGTYYPSYALGDRLGENVAVILLSPMTDAEATLVHILGKRRDEIPRDDVLALAREEYPDLSERAFLEMWPDARERAGLSREADAGRKSKPRKPPTNRRGRGRPRKTPS